MSGPGAAPAAGDADRATWLRLTAFLVLMGVGWGLTQPMAKIAVSEGYRHFGLVFWQLALGAVILGLVTLARGRRLPLGRRQIAFFALIAVIGTIAPNSASYQAAVHLPAGILSVITSMVPIFAFPIALALGIDRFGTARAAGLACGLAGVAILALPGASLPSAAMVAFLPLALLTPFFYAVEGNVVARWGTHGLDPVEVLLGASITGALIALPLALASGHWIDPRPPWGAPDAALAISSAVHVAVYVSYVWMVGRAGAVFAAQVAYLVTGAGIAWSMLLLGERYAAGFWLALALMLVGLFLVRPRSDGQRGSAIESPAPLRKDASG